MLGASWLSMDKGSPRRSRRFPRQWYAGGEALACVLTRRKFGCCTGREGFLARSCTGAAEEPGAARGQRSLGDRSCVRRGDGSKTSPFLLKPGKGSAPTGRRAGFAAAWRWSGRWSKAVSEQHPCSEGFGEEKDQKQIPSPKKSRSLAAPRQQTSQKALAGLAKAGVGFFGELLFPGCSFRPVYGSCRRVGRHLVRRSFPPPWCSALAGVQSRWGSGA